MKRNPNNHANNFRKFVKQNHASLYVLACSLGEPIRNEKVLGHQSPLTKPYRDAKERSVLFNHLVDFLWSLGSNVLVVDTCHL
jgi:hypothetical protein